MRRPGGGRGGHRPVARASLPRFSPPGAAWAAELEAVAERAEHVGRLLTQLPAPVLVVLRYLFTFLNQ